MEVSLNQQILWKSNFLIFLFTEHDIAAKFFSILIALKVETKTGLKLENYEIFFLWERVECRITHCQKIEKKSFFQNYSENNLSMSNTDVLKILKT